MTVAYMQAIRARYASLGYPAYRWYLADSAPPWQPLSKSLAASRVGVLSTAGAYVRGQVAYHYKDDTSLRALPMATADDDLRFSHITENYLVDAKRDPQCIVPLQPLRALAASGVIGGVAANAYSCMGGVYSQRRVRAEIAPAVLAAMQAEQVDAVLLIPM